MYTLGEPYTRAEASQTATLMFLDTLASHIDQVLELATAGPTAPVDVEQWLLRASQGAKADDLLMEAFPGLYQTVQGWLEANPVLDDMAIVRGFIALKDASSIAAVEVGHLDEQRIQELVVQVLADPGARSFVAGLADERAFSHVSKVLSPQARERAQALANVIPAIGDALEQLRKPAVETLVTQMQDAATRKKVLGWMKTDDFAARVWQERERRLRKLALDASSAIDEVELELSIAQFASKDWSAQKAIVDANIRFASTYLSQDEASEAIADVVEAHSGLAVDVFAQQLQGATARYQTAYSETTERYASLSRHLGELKLLLETAPASVGYLLRGGEHEFAALANALSGGYVAPASGGDPILNPGALPTGRNMFSIDAEKTPSEAAWKVGVAMARELIESHRQNTGAMPRKVAFTLWPSSFIHSEGATIAEILYLLGVEPVRDAFGRIQSLRLIPGAELGRPRVDVVVQSAGQLRDLAASRLALIEQAVKMTAQANDSGENYVREGVRSAEKYLLEQGQSPLAAKTLALRRSFGGVNNSYGTGIMGLVEESDRWENGGEIAGRYLQNMGAVYGEAASWGEFNQSLFAAALLDTEIIVQPRSSNTWGALSLDHVYEFMGGLSAAVSQVTGSTPAAYFNDFRNSARANLTNLEQTIWLEARTTLLNPSYITGLSSDGGASSAEVFAESFRNTFGWASMRPEAIDNALWQQLYEVYATDSHQLGLEAFFRNQNPYALQEMTGVMLEASRKGFWKATVQQQRDVAALHASLVDDYDPGCGSFTCGNPRLREFIEGLLDDSKRAAYVAALESAETGPASENAVVLVEKNPDGERSPGQADDMPPEGGENPMAQTTVELPDVLSGRIVAALLVALGLVATLVWLRRRRGG